MYPVTGRKRLKCGRKVLVNVLLLSSVRNGVYGWIHLLHWDIMRIAHLEPINWGKRVAQLPFHGYFTVVRFLSSIMRAYRASVCKQPITHLVKWEEHTVQAERAQINYQANFREQQSTHLVKQKERTVQASLVSMGSYGLYDSDGSNKAVSDGAISFYLDHFVRTRVSKITYGNVCCLLYDPTASDHRVRSHKVFTAVSGVLWISDFFDIILPKDTQVSETKEFRKPYYKESESVADFRSGTFPVWCYRGDVATPKWKDIDTNNYTELCTIEADLSRVPQYPLQKAGGRGTFYRIDYEMVLLFGLTELKAHVAWKENGIEKRSAAKIVYDPDTTNDDP
ncbi:hypothetical protein BYT27DRAFT_7243303 [Phlegmacium glaucopus]|nr:hypothetical protein BYT27DRAFT_7243303 [Phlegmacium glaucopus]